MTTEQPQLLPQAARPRKYDLPQVRPWQFSLHHRDRVRQAQNTALRGACTGRGRTVQPPAEPLGSNRSFSDRAKAAQRNSFNSAFSARWRSRLGYR